VDAPLSLEIDVDPSGAEVMVAARGSRGERAAPASLGPALGPDALAAFAAKVSRAAAAAEALPVAVVSDAQALYDAFFKGELRDLFTRLTEAAKDGRLLVRLMIRAAALQAVPWEAMCRPGTTEGFLAAAPKVLLARGVSSTEPWEPREVRGAVRVLAISPSADARSLDGLKDALSASIAAGEVEWLPPIAGPQAGQKTFFERLRRGPSPHVIHFLGHGGVDKRGRPVLRLADGADDEEAWIPAEALAQGLSASFGAELRLVFLEACEGASPGALGSAAEILAKAGADAVVAHLWPVKASVARGCSGEFYRTLTAADREAGDVAASLSAARRTMLLAGAEGFSPVLYLRGPGSVLFDFEGRRVAPPRAAATALSGLHPALLALGGRPFSMVVGDRIGTRVSVREAVRDELTQYLAENGDAGVKTLSFSALTQRCALRFGQETLHAIFQQAASGAIDAATPPISEAAARLLPPGVHVALLWLPVLERAIARRQPDRTVYAVQLAVHASLGRPRVVKRAAGATAWKMEPALPKRFELETDIVVLRLYGGYSPEPRSIFTSPMLTEDDHIQGLLGLDGVRPPEWMNELLASIRGRPSLFSGVSVLDWRHRMLLNWLYDKRPAPKDSLTVLTPGADPAEQEIWENGGGLPGAGRIAVVQEDLDALAAALEALPSREGR
jgi:CHAT domain